MAPKVDRRTKAGKAEWTKFAEAHSGAAVLTADDAELVASMANAIQTHPLGPHLFKAAEAELSGFYADPATGVNCRIRPDYARMEDGILLDLKTTDNADPKSFQRSIDRFGYHVQAAMYADGYKAIAGESLEDFLFVCIEKRRPFAVAVYRLDEAALEVGRQRYRQALATYAECKTRHRWPAYSDHVESISLPPWGLNNLEVSQDENY